ncbi:hypothetical protein ILUMI_15447 [Ignelater luminosus]|uniref:Transposable element P transposase-like GTP-binding insertion domain-containing protein n=1 Tax=Ignelater luminosus TaxID=2038154 RepID=A0A8K0CT09_IGNLU|nr:hypothetical protein ILUMI_15447 [Ignelater luminosus]
MYTIDKKLSNKLTDAHLHPTNYLKKKVSLATQLLSASVANALGALIALGHLFTDATETQKCCSAKVPNRAFKGDANQLEVLNRALVYLHSVRIIDSKGKDYN